MLRVMRFFGFVAAGESELSRQHWMFEQQALQEYILLCCQNPTGGLLDKPGKSVPHHLDTHTMTHSHSLQSNMIHMVLLIHINPPLVMWSCVQIQRFLPHVLLPERPLHRAALRQHGPPSRADPWQGGEQTGEPANYCKRRENMSVESVLWRLGADSGQCAK